MLTSKVDQALLSDANELLWMAAAEMKSDWRSQMKHNLPESERTWAYTRLAGQYPIGAIPEGTGRFREKTGFEFQPFRKAVALLKYHGRILQVGQGKGKILLVMDKTPILSEEVLDPATISDSKVEAAKVLQLVSRLNTLKSQNVWLVEENTKLRKRIEAQ